MTYPITLNNAAFADAGAFGQARTAGNGPVDGHPLVGSNGNYVPFHIDFFLTIPAGGGGNLLLQAGAINWYVDKADGRGHFNFGNGPDNKATDINLADGVRHHVRVSVDSTDHTNTVVLSIDGQPQWGWATGQAGGLANFDNGAVLYLFTGPAGTDFVGTVDEVAIFRGAPGAVAYTVPTAPYTGNEADLIALWHLDGNGNDSAVIVDTTAPTLVSARVSNVLIGDTAPGLEVKFSEGLAAPDFAATAFALSGSHALGAVDASARSVGILRYPITGAFAVGEVVTLNYTAPGGGTGVRDAAGNFAATFSNFAVTNEVTNHPTLPGYVLKTFGDSLDGYTDDFATPADINTYLSTLAVPAGGKPVMIWLKKDLNLTGMGNFGPASSDNNNYVIMRPAPGLSIEEVEPSTADGHYGTQGIRVFTDSAAAFRVGIVLEDLRMYASPSVSDPYAAFSFRRDGWSHVGNIIGLRRCRVVNDSTTRMFRWGEYGASAFIEDSLLLQQGANGSAVIRYDADGAIRRSTIRRLNAGDNGAAATEGSAGLTLENTIISKCGGNPVNNVNADHCYTDVPYTGAGVGFTYVSGAMFQTVSADASGGNYRPATGSPMINGASASAVSLNDANGNNRGTQPDAGCFQLSPGVPLVIAQVTSQTIDGQTLTITCATQGTVGSGMVTLSPDNPANGAQAIGPFAFTIGVNTATVVIHDVEPGNYLAPTITFTNTGGTSGATGASAFEIIGVGGNAVDPGATEPATAILWAQAPTSAVIGQPVTFRVGLNGAQNVAVSITPSAVDGTFSPSGAIALTNGMAQFTYTPASVGNKAISLTNSASLANPAPVTVTAASAAQPAPTIAITTPDAGILTAAKAVLAGTCDLKNDLYGKVELFIDPQPSGAPLGPFTVSASNTAWNVQKAGIAAGLFRLRVVATANGQTAAASTGDLRIQSLSGTVNLPAS